MRQHELPSPASLSHQGPGQQSALGAQKCHFEGRAGNFGASHGLHCWHWREFPCVSLAVPVTCLAQQLRSCLVPLGWTAESLYGDTARVFGALPWQDSTKPHSALCHCSGTQWAECLPKKQLGNRPTQNETFLRQATLLPFCISKYKKIGKTTLSSHLSAYE